MRQYSCVDTIMYLFMRYNFRESLFIAHVNLGFLNVRGYWWMTCFNKLCINHVFANKTWFTVIWKCKMTSLSLHRGYWPISGFFVAAESLLLKSLEKKPDFCSACWLAGSDGEGFSTGIGCPVPTGVLPTDVDSLGVMVDFWSEGMDKDFGTVGKINLFNN